jgi:hypothetical protein
LPFDIERTIAAWCEHDVASALHVPDREAVRATDAARALVLELLAKPNAGRDLYNACASFGRLLADRGASPSLAVLTLEGAVRALSDAGVTCDPARVAPARASIAEGYFAAVVEAERNAARRVWEYPACAVKVAKDTVAIVAGHPADDGEALADWSARVALGVSKDGYGSAIVTGTAPVKAELAAALSLVGIDLVENAEAKGWLSFLKR